MKYKVSQTPDRHPELVSGSPHAHALLRESFDMLRASSQDDFALWTNSSIALVKVFIYAN